MYQSYFGLQEAPFSIAPNPRYLYMSKRHSEALAHLVYGIETSGGFILLTGEVGTGKTTICRQLLGQLPDDVDTAFIINPKQTADEILASICDDLGIGYPPEPSTKILIDRLNKYLLEELAAGRRTLVIIDEAQNLSIEVLEQLRLLTNLETDERKLLQIVLLGQPELLTILSTRALRQLSQRITARFHLDALTRSEVREYIIHRLAVAGVERPLFTNGAVNRVYRLSGGIPRVINLICDRALLGAYSRNAPMVTAKLVQQAAGEILSEPRSNGWIPAIASGLAAAATIVIASMLHFNGTISSSSERVEPAPSITRITEQPPTPPHLEGHVSRREALNDLLALWGLYLESPDAEPCAAISVIELSCLAPAGGASRVLQLNRPVIFRMTARDEWITLSALRREGQSVRATLIASERQYEVPFRVIADDLDAGFTLIWRMPPGFKGPIRPGDTGEDVEWLASRLSDLDNVTPDSVVGSRYDDTLMARVKRFQAAMQLPANGIVDPIAWIHLNNIGESEVPMLDSGDG